MLWDLIAKAAPIETLIDELTAMPVSAAANCANWCRMWLPDLEGRIHDLELIGDYALRRTSICWKRLKALNLMELEINPQRMGSRARGCALWILCPHRRSVNPDQGEP